MIKIFNKVESWIKKYELLNTVNHINLVVFYMINNTVNIFMKETIFSSSGLFFYVARNDKILSKQLNKMKPKVIDVTSTEEEIENTSTDEEITTVVEEIECKMKNVQDKPKQTKKKDLSNVKAEDIIEDKPKKMSKLSNVKIKAEDIVEDK